MADQEGLDQLRVRLERRSRSVPPPRRPRELEAPVPPSPNATDSRPDNGPDHHLDTADHLSVAEPAHPGASADVSEADAPTVAPEPAPMPPQRTTRDLGTGFESPSAREGANRGAMRESAPSSYVATGDEPTANLTLRVRQPLDLRLAELIHGLRREGVRSSKKELIEMCLSEFPLEPTDDLRDRLRRYRDSVPKEPL